MRGESSTAARLAFHGMRDESHLPPHISVPPPGPRDSGPSIHHRLHGCIPVDRGELRVTSQPARGTEQPARLVVRVWHQRKSDGTWWTDPDQPGVFITAKDVRAFGEAVAAACAALEQGCGGGGES